MNHHRLRRLLLLLLVMHHMLRWGLTVVGRLFVVVRLDRAMLVRHHLAWRLRSLERRSTLLLQMPSESVMSYRDILFFDIVRREKTGSIEWVALALRHDSAAIPLFVYCRQLLALRASHTPSSSMINVSPCLNVRSSCSCLSARNNFNPMQTEHSLHRYSPTKLELSAPAYPSRAKQVALSEAALVGNEQSVSG